MAGLILRLRPHEELLINGVLLQNGDRKANLRVKTDGAAILRLRDAIRPEEATTPARQAYYIAQLAVSGQMDGQKATAMLSDALAKLAAASQGQEQRNAIDRAAGELEAGRLYSVMRRLRQVIEAKPCAQASA